MLRLKAERRSPSTVSGATASESLTKTPDVVHSTRTTGDTSSVRPRTYDAPLRTWTDALAFLIFATLIVASAVITLYMLIAFLFTLGQAVT